MNRAIRSSNGQRHRQAGFSLLEIVLATVLLAAGLTLAYATLRTATGSAQRGEVLALRSERMRAVQAFVRRQLAGALPLPLPRDDDTAAPLLLRTDDNAVSFSAPMPGYLARGGAYMQTLQLVRDGRDYRLEFDYRMLVGDQLIEPRRPPPPEVLLRGVAQARFEFLGTLADGELGDWSEQWDAPLQLPLLARVTLRFTDPRQRWPTLVVPLRLGAATLARELSRPIDPIAPPAPPPPEQTR